MLEKSSKNQAQWIQDYLKWVSFHALHKVIHYFHKFVYDRVVTQAFRNIWKFVQKISQADWQLFHHFAYPTMPRLQEIERKEDKASFLLFFSHQGHFSIAF